MPSPIDPLMHSVPLTDEEYEQFALFIYQHSGIHLGDNKKELVKARLMKRIRHLHCRSFSEYYHYMQTDTTGQEFVEFMNAMSTNVTSFFREKEHFDFLAHKALPEICQRKEIQRDKKIRVWSAACSTGEEVYTLLMTLLEHIADPRRWDIKVLGTDISTRVLAFAETGVYGNDKIGAVPPSIRERYFNCVRQGAGASWQVKETVKQYATFARLNLMMENFPFKNVFDIIFCRNVMIYFDKKTQETLVKKFYRFLAAQGFLFIGHSESLVGVDLDFMRVHNAAFRKT